MATPPSNNLVFRLAPGVRVRKQSPGGTSHPDGSTPRVLLAPEKFFLLELSESAILEFCRGEVPLEIIVQELRAAFGKEADDEFAGSIRDYLGDLVSERLLISEPASGPFQGDLQVCRSALDQLVQDYSVEPSPPANGLPIPRLLLAEVTHRCPLHCPYCSNPTELVAASKELATAEWARVFQEAAGLGVLHAGLSGGEPLARRDLPELVAAARAAGLYTNLITSAIGLTRDKARRLQDAGLDSIQISFQADEPALADEIAGHTAHILKQAAMRMVVDMQLPLTLNVVLHRGNIDRLEKIIAFAEAHGAHQLELANVQFYGWAMQNRDQLLPTRDQVKAADAIARSAQARLRDKMDVIYVLPDYFGTFPKPCMQGWGRQYLTVNPSGEVLPCPTAGGIPGLRFDNIRQNSLAWIWKDSEAFNRFRGFEWMPEPCRSCDLRFEDFGGCRCQAALIAGDAAFTDPACAKSPYRNKLTEILDRQNADMNGEPKPYVYRGMRTGSERPMEKAR
jgi:pyrroloquinoline quinone biosynthesis protein E